MPRQLIWICLSEQSGRRGGGKGDQQSSSGDEGEGGGGADTDAQEGGSSKAPAGTAAARLARMALQVCIRNQGAPLYTNTWHGVVPIWGLHFLQGTRTAVCPENSIVKHKASR